MSIMVYTDGGCEGNPGPGAWAFILREEGEVVERSGAESATTNNRMELTAVIEALRESGSRRRAGGITLVTDSLYVQQGITLWIKNWLSRGWVTADRRPVKNQDLWKLLWELDKELHPSWRWTRGHAGDPLNEAVDRLVRRAIRQLRYPEKPPIDR